MARRTRVMIVDDHEVVRLGLRALFELEADLEVVAEVASGEAAAGEAERTRPDVVVMDVRMGAMDGIEACRALREQRPDIGVLMLTSFGTEEAVLAAIMAGASGFLLKNTGRDELLRAVRAVGAGDSLLDPTVTGTVMRRLAELAASAEDPRLAQLSAREREVLQLVAEGLTNREIAERLVIARVTARNHVSRILDKLGMQRRTEIAAFAASLRPA